MIYQLIIESSFLGILQGLTEFLPISSSAHLVIAQQFFPRLTEKPLLLSIILHLGTFFALFFYFWPEIKKLFYQPKKFLPIIYATIITIILVFPFRNLIEQTFIFPKFAGAMLIVTSFFLFLASQKKNNNQQRVDSKKAIKIGLTQAIATLPGISRSGITISTGILLGLETLIAFKFSFLLAMPVIAGASILELFDLRNVSKQLMISYFFGFIFAFLAGLWALKFLMTRVVKNKKNLFYFSLYCLFLGVLTILFF